MKNQIHGMLLGYGITTKVAQLQSNKKLQALVKDFVDQSFTEADASVKVILGIIEGVQKQINVLEKYLREMARDDEDMRRLMTIPGVGFLTVSTIAAYTKDLNKRFCGYFKRFASYVGIAPSLNNSNKTVFMDRISKHDLLEPRTAFVWATMEMIRLFKVTCGWKLMTDYQAMKTGKGSGKSIIATTRKLARIIFAMFHNRDPFNPALRVRGKCLLTVKDVIGA